MPRKNVITWNATISGSVECGDLDLELKLLEKAPVREWWLGSLWSFGTWSLGGLDWQRDCSVRCPRSIYWLGMLWLQVIVRIAEPFRTMLWFGIQPNSSTLNNIYWLRMLWLQLKRLEHVARFQKSKKSCKMVKTPSCSCIEIKSMTHQLRSGDRVRRELASTREKP